MLQRDNRDKEELKQIHKIEIGAEKISFCQSQEIERKNMEKAHKEDGNGTCEKKKRHINRRYNNAECY